MTIDSSGDVWVADGGNDRVEEFSSEGKYLKQLGRKAREKIRFTHPPGITISEGGLYVVDEGDDRVEEFSTSGTDTELGHFGSSGSGNGDFSDPTWIATDPASGDLYVTDWGQQPCREVLAGRGLLGEVRRGKRTAAGSSSIPEGVAVDTSGDVYVLTWGEKSSRRGVGAAQPPATKARTTPRRSTTPAEANSKYPECGEHPEWANLPCETKPAEQPGTSGLPNCRPRHTPTTSGTSPKRRLKPSAPPPAPRPTPTTPPDA